MSGVSERAQSSFNTARVAPIFFFLFKLEIHSATDNLMSDPTTRFCLCFCRPTCRPAWFFLVFLLLNKAKKSQTP